MSSTGTHGVMRRRLIFAAVVASVLILTTTLIFYFVSDNEPTPSSFEGGEDYVDHVLSEMTLEEKVGQLFMTYVYGSTVDSEHDDIVAANQDAHGVDNAHDLIDQYHLGGVVYFTWADNIETPTQVAELSNGIQEAATTSGAEVPALVATDQEHGLITRVGEPATELPGNMALGASGEIDDVRLAGAISAQELAAMGLNYNFAPVADVNVNPDNPVIGVRSYSADPQLVSELTFESVIGHQRFLAAAAKHFPGHGDTNVDSHLDLPELTHDRDQWEEVDAPPFEAAIDAGVDSIMSAHLQFPALDDSGTPATLSQPIMTDLLRDEMGFEGVVVTDSLEMEGVRANYSDAEIPVKALQAGADLLLMPEDLEVAYDAVIDAVDDGELTEERLDESVTRILQLKYDRGIVDNSHVNAETADNVVGSAKNIAAGQDITDATTTIVTNEEALPIEPDSAESVVITGADADVVENIAGQFPNRGIDDVETIVLDDDLSNSDTSAEIAAAEDADTVVALTGNLSEGDGNVALVNDLIDTGSDVIVVATENPYDIAYIDSPGAFIATYSTTEPAVRSLAGVLFGERDATGRLPVDIPDGEGDILFPIGHGLMR